MWVSVKRSAPVSNPLTWTANCRGRPSQWSAREPLLRHTQSLQCRLEWTRKRVCVFLSCFLPSVLLFLPPSSSSLKVSWLILTRSAWPVAPFQVSSWRSSCYCWEPGVSACPAAKDVGVWQCNWIKMCVCLLQTRLVWWSGLSQNCKRAFGSSKFRKEEEDLFWSHIREIFIIRAAKNSTVQKTVHLRNLVD